MIDYEKKYNEALEKAKHALYSHKAGVVTTDKVLIEAMFPELQESEDEKIRKALIDYFDDAIKADVNPLQSYGTRPNKVIDWLEKQKATDKEIVFRPLAGTDIIVAAKQALEKIEIGKEVVLAFNGAYIPVNGKTVGEIDKEYDAWVKKQNEKKYTFRLENYDEAEKEKASFVGDGFIECQADFLDFKEGNTYWLEYISDDKYNVRSDNLLGKTYHITPGQLYTVFKKLTWLEKQNKNNSEDYCEDCVNKKGCINCENGNLKETISLDSCEKQDEQDFSHNVNDEIRNELYDFIYITTFQPKDLKKKERFLDWLEKQGNNSNQTWKPSKEQINALEHFVRSIGESGYASPYDDNTNRIKSLLNDLCKLKKQGEKKVSSVDFKAKDWYVSNVDGKIHDVTYNAANNVEKKDETKNEQEALNNWYVEYIYILDYSTGRVIVAKHDVEESISELFEQLGLKESQCHYMVSSNVLSIEYINF